MVISLTTPFSVGDLSPDTFPHCYITSFVVNGRAQNLLATYEYGLMQSDGTWVPTPVPTGGTLLLSGEELSPFFSTLPTDLAKSLWDQVTILSYGELQKRNPRMAGTIMEPVGATPAQIPLDLASSGTTPNANV
jgi:hypothetical protein